MKVDCPATCRSIVSTFFSLRYFGIGKYIVGKPLLPAMPASKKIDELVLIDYRCPVSELTAGECGGEVEVDEGIGPLSHDLHGQGLVFPTNTLTSSPLNVLRLEVILDLLPTLVTTKRSELCATYRYLYTYLGRYWMLLKFV